MRELALFAGAGGGLLASRLLGWRAVCAVEIDTYCQKALLERQRSRDLPRFPIWDDVRTFDGRPWRGHVDVVSGGFPCQDISTAGQGRGLAGERSGLVFEMLRIVGEVRPTFVLAENSPNLRTTGLAVIVERLIRMGYVGRVGVLGARHIGANHDRKRMWIVAIAKGAATANPNDLRGLQSKRRVSKIGQWLGHRAEQPFDPHNGVTDWWSVPRFAGMDDGVASRLDRIKATGNGQVPGVAALAWSVLTSDLTANTGMG